MICIIYIQQKPVTVHAGKTAPAALAPFVEEKKKKIKKTRETFNCLRTGSERVPSGVQNREGEERPAAQTVARQNFKQIIHTARGRRGETVGY